MQAIKVLLFLLKMLWVIYKKNNKLCYPTVKYNIVKYKLKLLATNLSFIY